MPELKNILIIIGSASNSSSNEKLMQQFALQTTSIFNTTVFTALKSLPHFNPEESTTKPPAAILAFRQSIAAADGVIICTPEYIFSIPSGLKNAIEWCVADIVWEGKPLGIITASAHGQQGHDELKRIMQTVSAKFNDQTTWLIQGIKGKVNAAGQITDEATKKGLLDFIEAFTNLVN